MRSLKDIGVKIESLSFHHNALPILHELRHALVRLAEAGESKVIDLRAIPFGPGDERLLLDVLGEGEVSATVNALGPTLVRETAFPGVWLVDYRDATDGRVALQIEVAEVPGILRSQPEDVRDAAQRLGERLEGLGEPPSPAG
jgi:HupH hydrogenase expression protein, C-terminal conserved region